MSRPSYRTHNWLCLTWGSDRFSQLEEVSDPAWMEITSLPGHTQHRRESHNASGNGNLYFDTRSIWERICCRLWCCRKGREPFYGRFLCNLPPPPQKKHGAPLSLFLFGKWQLSPLSNMWTKWAISLSLSRPKRLPPPSAFKAWCCSFSTMKKPHWSKYL